MAAVCCNMTGTEKCLLFVTGKLQNPRCFKNVKSLPVMYKANKRAWMTGELFEEWVVAFDRKMKRQKRKVLLFVDNCPANTDVANLSATKLVFQHNQCAAAVRPGNHLRFQAAVQKATRASCVALHGTEM